MLKKSHAIVAALAVVLAVGIAPTATGTVFIGDPLKFESAAEAKQKKYRNHVLAYEGDGQRWAIPYHVVVCESGVRGSITSGYYGILVSSWHAMGGGKYASVPGGATHWEQSVIAAKIRDLGGSSGWSCWS